MIKKFKELKTVDKIKIIAGALGWAVFAEPVVVSGIINLGNAAGMIFFGVMFFWGIFGKRLREKKKEKTWAKVLTGVLISGYILFTSLFAVESVFMVEALTRTPPENSTLIVLGCTVYGESPSQMLVYRIDAAEEFLKENPSSVAVLSGGQGENEDIPEALCMYRELIARGISPARLYIEDKSTNTKENISFSLDIVEEYSLSENIAVVSNNFHVYRATLPVENEGYECYCIGGKTAPALLPTYIVREYLGIVKQWITG